MTIFIIINLLASYRITNLCSCLRLTAETSVLGLTVGVVPVPVVGVVLWSTIWRYPFNGGVL